MVISFSLIRLSPGDPAAERLGAGAEPEAIEQLREQLGLNKGAFEQFIDYFSGLLRGDLGVSLVNGVGVLETIQRTFPLTLTYITLSVEQSLDGPTELQPFTFLEESLQSSLQPLTSLSRWWQSSFSAFSATGRRCLDTSVNFQKI
jgi:hypothetical protein